MNNGVLYGVGVGPGDPELITVKALKVIEGAQVIALPDSGGGSEGGRAYAVAAKVVDLSAKELLKLPMPMTKDTRVLNASHDEAARVVMEKLESGCDVAFLTLGDPSVYSTYMYVHKRVAQGGYETRMVEGVPSFCAAAARLNVSLCEGDQALHILPAACQDEAHLGLAGTKVLMKSGRDFEETRECLRRCGLLDKAVMAERCGMKEERVYRDLYQVSGEKSYFSVIIVREC